jgi:hypothetical protein
LIPAVNLNVSAVVVATFVLSVAGSPVPAVARARSQTAPLEVAAFLEELDRLRGALDAADPTAAARLADTLPSRWVVRVQDHVIEVPSETIVQGLRQAAVRGQKSRRDAVRRQFAALRAEALDALDAPHRSRDALHAVLREVLDRPEFQSGWASVWARSLRERVTRWLRNLWSSFGAASLGSRQIALTFAWTAALVAFMVLTVGVARMLTRATGVSALRLPPPARERGSREWVDRALAAARAGDGREAVRCAHRAAIHRLAEDGVWRLDDSRTPREYVQLLPPGHERGAPLFELTRLFEQIWYGRRLTTVDDAAGLSRRLEDLGCLPKRQT